MFQFQLVNREAPNLLSMPGLVDSHALRASKVAVEAPKVNPEQPAPSKAPEEAPKKKIGRPRKVKTEEASEAPETSEAPVKAEKPKKKLDISKSKIY